MAAHVELFLVTG